MSCWQILGIAESSDKKTIKVAYARLLKKNRPDENPKGFGQLHDAYLSALAILKQQARQENSPQNQEEPFAHIEQLEPPSEQVSLELADVNDDCIVSFTTEEVETISPQQDIIETLSDEFSNEDFNLPLVEEDEPTPPQVDLFQQDWDNLFSKVNTCIANPLKCFYPKDWEFIEQIGSILDLEFRSKVSSELLQRALEVNQDKSVNDLIIKPVVLDYLNRLFNWGDKWVEYSKTHDSGSLDGVFPHLKRVSDPEEIEKSIDYYIQSVMPHDLKHKGVDYENLDDFTLRRRILYGLNRASAYGFDVAMYQFINLMWLVGPHFYLYRGIVEIEDSELYYSNNNFKNITARINEYTRLASNINEWDVIASDDWFIEPVKGLNGYNYVTKTAEVEARQSHAISIDETEKVETLVQPSNSTETSEESTIEEEKLPFEQQQDWDKLMLQVRHTLNEPQKCTLPKDWNYIELPPSMADDIFRSKVSKILFSLISSANRSAETSGALIVNSNVLSYLNKVFSWKKESAYFEEWLLHYPEFNASIFPHLNKPVHPEALEVIINAAFQVVPAYLMALTQEYDPTSADMLDNEMIAYAIEKAISYGFNEPAEQYKFLSLMIYASPHFYLFPTFTYILDCTRLSNEVRLEYCQSLAKKYQIDIVDNDWFHEPEKFTTPNPFI